MIIHKKLAEKAVINTFDISSDDSLEHFLIYINENKLRSRGLTLNYNEVKELLFSFRDKRISASCFHWDGTPPCILLHQSEIKVYSAIWRHERFHFQLLTLRRMTNTYSCTYLILHFLNHIPKKNLKIFFQATLSRYRSLLSGKDASPASRLRFIEELLTAALIDYAIEPTPSKYLKLINRQQHARTLKSIRKFIRKYSIKNRMPISFNIYDKAFTRARAMYIGRQYYNVISACLSEPNADFFVT